MFFSKKTRLLFNDRSELCAVSLQNVDYFLVKSLIKSTDNYALSLFLLSQGNGGIDFRDNPYFMCKLFKYLINYNMVFYI